MIPATLPTNAAAPSSAPGSDKARAKDDGAFADLLDGVLSEPPGDETTDAEARATTDETSAGDRVAEPRDDDPADSAAPAAISSSDPTPTLPSEPLPPVGVGSEDAAEVLETEQPTSEVAETDSATEDDDSLATGAEPGPRAVLPEQASDRAQQVIELLRSGGRPGPQQPGGGQPVDDTGKPAARSIPPQAATAAEATTNAGLTGMQGGAEQAETVDPGQSTETGQQTSFGELVTDATDATGATEIDTDADADVDLELPAESEPTTETDSAPATAEIDDGSDADVGGDAMPESAETANEDPSPGESPADAAPQTDAVADADVSIDASRPTDDAEASSSSSARSNGPDAPAAVVRETGPVSETTDGVPDLGPDEAGSAPAGNTSQTPAPTAAPAPATIHATGAATPAPAAGPPTPLVDQLVTHVTPLAQGPDGTHQVTIELTPDELGRVTLEVTVEKGVVHVRLHADDPASRRLLAASLGDLRSALDTADLRAGSLDVGQHGQQPGRNHGADADPQGRGGARAPGSTEAEHPAPTSTIRRTVAADQALDVLL